jgi:hypothetical protein
MIVKRDGNAAIAKVREDIQSVFQTMMRETIGVVAPEHLASLPSS